MTTYTHPRLVEEPSGLRFHLGDRGIHAGDTVVLHLGAWTPDTTIYGERCIEVPVRVEWSYQRGAPVLLYPPDGSELRCTPDAFERLSARWPEQKRPEIVHIHERRIRRGRVVSQTRYAVHLPNGERWRFRRETDAEAFVEAGGCAEHVEGRCRRCHGERIEGDGS